LEELRSLRNSVNHGKKNLMRNKKESKEIRRKKKITASSPAEVGKQNTKH